MRWSDLQRCAVAAAVLAAAAAAPSRAADSAAVVTVTAPAATTTVTAADLAHWLDVARATDGASSVPRRVLERQVLQLLVQIAWTDGETVEQGIVVTDAEVQQRFEQERRQSFPKLADFHRFLRHSHQTVADILLRVRDDIESERLRDKVTVPAAAAVTDAVVDAAVQKAGPKVVAETRDIRLVIARTRREARRAIINHRAPMIHADRRTSLPPRVRRVAFRAARGRVVGPVRASGVRFYLEVVRIHARHVLPLAQQRAQTRARLVSDAEQKALDAFVTAFHATWRARTTCAPAYIWYSDCANWDGTTGP